MNDINEDAYACIGIFLFFVIIIYYVFCLRISDIYYSVSDIFDVSIEGIERTPRNRSTIITRKKKSSEEDFIIKKDTNDNRESKTAQF